MPDIPGVWNAPDDEIPTPHDLVCAALLAGDANEEVGYDAYRILSTLAAHYIVLPRKALALVSVSDVPVEGDVL